MRRNHRDEVIKEIASLMGISQKEVKKKAAEALKILQIAMQQKREEEEDR